MVLRAMQLAGQLKGAGSAAPSSSSSKTTSPPLPFSHLTFCNIGNPHELAQKPITFFRQVAALVNYPPLLDDPRASAAFAPDAIERARRYLAGIPGGVGAYTHSQGIELIREEVAQFITRRDGGIPSHASDIFLTDGASPGVQFTLKALIRDERDAILVPIPQYPLYSASIALYGGTMANYYLDEANDWALTRGELERAAKEARDRGLNLRAIVVINPGNPTGNTLSASNMRDVVSFASENGLILLADEVYQENVWTREHPWLSFKRIAVEMGKVDPSRTRENTGLQLVSFHSTSKGYTGECGRRGGLMELCGFDDAVRLQLYKLASISLCANSAGQVMVGLMVNPPKPGDASYASYRKERDDILASLSRRASRLVAAFDRLEGVSCQPSEGALYAFPQITLSRKAVAAAKAAGKAPDTFYCLALLDATGIVVVPVRLGGRRRCGAGGGGGVATLDPPTPL
jgi:alanine transaminase